MKIKDSISDRTQLENLIKDALTVDGERHKQWYIEEIAKELGFDPTTFTQPLEYEPGIAP